ncbi:MAG: hypothetical protein P4L93_02225 [Coriobacteriia bacterium]|nr:hypothetical protein [Coriobacteriia bacterium]
MGYTQTGSSFTQLLTRLAEEAIARDVLPEVAEEALRATRQGVRVPAGPVSPQTARRTEAYFSAVVRRRSVRRQGSPRAAARFVVATVVEDLRSSGRSGTDIWDELERGWAKQVPVDVLEEYRLRLCG